MRMDLSVGRHWLATVCGLWLLSSSVGIHSVVRAEDQRPDDAIDVEVEIQGDLQLATPKFWIGISGHAVDDTLKSQLKLDNGIVISQVMDGSPAAKAGLRQHDVVVQLNDASVERIQDFFRPVAESDGEPLKLKAYRGGKVQDIVILPERRPHDAHAHIRIIDDERHNEELDVDVGQRFLFVNPGTITNRIVKSLQDDQDGGALNWFSNVQDDVRIKIEKNGKEPARITVQRGDKKWKVDEKHVDELPKDVRGMLQQGNAAWVGIAEGSASNLVEQLVGKRIKESENIVRKYSFFTDEEDIEIEKSESDERDERDAEELDERLDRLTEMLERLQKDVDQLKD